MSESVCVWVPNPLLATPSGPGDVGATTADGGGGGAAAARHPTSLAAKEASFSVATRSASSPGAAPSPASPVVRADLPPRGSRFGYRPVPPAGAQPSAEL